MLHNEENPLKLRKNASEGKENDNVQILQPQCQIIYTKQVKY
jgi:hypothetical protein